MKKVATFGGQDIYSYTISNNSGMSLTALTYGAAITELNVPNNQGKSENVVIRYDDVSFYEENPHYLGVIVGRTAGRTEDGVLNIGQETYQLEKNDGNNHLHGGKKGLAKSIWDVTQEDGTLTFTYISPDGEDGYPGEVQFKVSYHLSDQNQLIIHYWAKPNKRTPINLTNHSYFNLTGDKKRDVLGHRLKINSSTFYELNAESIPLSKKLADEKPVFDFRHSKTLSEVVSNDYEQIKIVGGGIDHPFLLDDSQQEKIVLSDPTSGRSLGVKTDDPAVVIYSGNQIKEQPALNGGTAEKYDGICIETQMPPNETESYLVDAGAIYQKQTIFSFY
ncbi:aldose epimerase family protein [Salipaludibacillus keqinensis]|nr:aldose epimerase family protein [Salipaludibacillus keqinensis]